jgi:hypothetical protein
MLIIKVIRLFLNMSRLIKRKIFHSFSLNIIVPLIKHIIAPTAVANSHEILENQSLDAAIRFLKKEYKLYRPQSVKFLISFFHHLKAASASDASREKDSDLILHLCCWGRPYYDKLKYCLLPSLLSDGNLPSITKKYKTIIIIDCDARTKKGLLNSQVLKKIKKIASIRFRVIPRHIIRSYNSCLNYPKFLFFNKMLEINRNLRYTFLGCLQNQALENALKNKSYISFLMPDFILSNDFFTKLFEEAKDKKAALATGFRTDYQKVLADLEGFYGEENKTQLSIEASNLTHLKIKHIHDDAKRRVVSPSTINFTPTAQLLFETKNGFVVRSFHLHPVLLNCKKYSYSIKKDYYPIDRTVLNQAIDQQSCYKDQIYICDNASEIAFMELSDSNAHTASLNRTIKLNQQQLINAIKLMTSSCPDVFGTKLNHYFSSIRIRFECPKISKTGCFIPDEEFFSELKKPLTS